MKKNLLLKTIAIALGVSGIAILTGVFIPIASYERNSNEKYPTLLNPEVTRSDIISDYAKNSDYTKASNWFIGGKNRQDFTSPTINYYTISIPKLRIDKATVSVGGEDLSKSLIQYPGTALPGKLGNSVIFGHSILPLFYNPKNYESIFSLIPRLKVGDEINIDYDGVSYMYRVEKLFEVLPTDLQVLDQDTSDSFLTLVTCVPPGDPNKPKRLIVRARIVPSL